MATKKASVKSRSTKKTTAKKTVKKSPVKKVATDKATSGGASSNGLRKPQVRVLNALASGKSLTRKQISEKGSVDLAMLNSYIGSNDEDIRRKNDEKVMPSLLTLGLVKFGASDDERGTAYEITAKGKKELDKLS